MFKFIIKRPIYNSCNNQRVVVFPALPILACRGMCQRRVWMACLKPPACSRLLVMVASRLRNPKAMPLRVSSLRYGRSLCSNTHMVSSVDLLSVRIVNMNRSPSFLT